MYCHAYSCRGHIALTLLSCALLASCSPSSDESETEVQRFGSEEDIKVEIYLTPLLPMEASENGGEARFEVSLNEEPLEDLIIRFTSQDPGEVGSGAVLFSSSNWGIPQEVALGGVDDALLDGDQQVTVDVEIITLDARYAALSIDPLTITNLDNEDPDWYGIGTTSPSSSGGNGGNGGNGGTGNGDPVVPGSPTSPHLTYEDGRETLVSFSSNQPHDHPIRVSLEIDDPSEGRIITLMHANDPSISNDTENSFSFEPDRWPETWNVVIRGIDDGIADGNIPYTITMQVTYEDPDIDTTMTQQIHLLSIDGVCGNGVLESNEACDDGNTEVDTCNYDEECCNVCGPSCFEVEGLPGGTCGDGLLQPGEVCDPNAPDPCSQPPFEGGVSECVEDCSRLDTSRCFMSAPPDLHINNMFVCQLYGVEDLACAGSNAPSVNELPNQDKLSSLVLEFNGGFYIDQGGEIRAWGGSNFPASYSPEGRSRGIDRNALRLCSATTSGSTVCWESSSFYKILRTGIAPNSRPQKIALDDIEINDYCVLFDDNSVACRQTHADPEEFSRQLFPSPNTEIVELAVQGRWLCALADHDGLFCDDGEQGTMAFDDVRGFHLGEELCIVDKFGTLSCPTNPGFLDNFDTNITIDERENLQDVAFSDRTFCVLRTDRTTRCWGSLLSMDRALAPVPWERSIERFLINSRGVFLKNHGAPWTAVGRSNTFHQIDDLDDIEEQAEIYGLQQITAGPGFYCGLLGNGEISCPYLLPLPSEKQPYRFLLEQGEFAGDLWAVNAASELERHEAGENAPRVYTEFASYLQGIRPPIASILDDLICMAGPQTFTTCVTDHPDGPPDAPDFLQDISLGFLQSCGIRNGGILCWDHNFPDQVYPPGYFVQIETDGFEHCARDTAGEVWCWRLSPEPPYKGLPGDGYETFKMGDSTRCGIRQGELICRGKYMMGGMR